MKAGLGRTQPLHRCTISVELDLEKGLLAQGRGHSVVGGGCAWLVRWGKVRLMGQGGRSIWGGAQELGQQDGEGGSKEED